MHQLNAIQAKPHRRRHSGAVGTILGIVVAAAVLFAVPGPGLAANWLAPGSDQTVTAPWVKDIAAELNEAPYRDVFANGMGEPPHSAVVRYLNGAAQAIKAGNKPLAQSYLNLTLAIFDNGERRGILRTWGRGNAQEVNPDQDRGRDERRTSGCGRSGR